MAPPRRPERARPPFALSKPVLSVVEGSKGTQQTPRSYNGAMPIGILHRLCAVKIVDKQAESGENRAIAPSLAGAGYAGPYTQ